MFLVKWFIRICRIGSTLALCKLISMLGHSIAMSFIDENKEPFRWMMGDIGWFAKLLIFLSMVIIGGLWYIITGAFEEKVAG